MSRVALDRVQTPRMVAERLSEAHLDDLGALLRDPRVARTLMPTGEPPSEAEVLAGLDAKIRHWDQYGFGLWVLRDRAEGTMVGRGGCSTRG